MKKTPQGVFFYIIKKGSDDDDNFDDEVKLNGAKRKEGIYVPPKIKPVYNGK